MISYTIQKLEHPTHIIFFLEGHLSKRVAIKEKFPDYRLVESEKYYVDLNNNELVILENYKKIMKSMRPPTMGHISFDGNIYRPAIQSDIDKNEEKYKSQNWDLYKYLYNYYKNCEIFLSDNQMIGIHISKSDDENDLFLDRYKKEGDSYILDKQLHLPCAVRELQYCKGPTLKEKYEELIYKNLESPYIRKSLIPYVDGVFKLKKDRYERYDDSDDDFENSQEFSDFRNDVGI
jgi:hypothetical protein